MQTNLATPRYSNLNLATPIHPSDYLKPSNLNPLVGFDDKEWFGERKKEHSENNAEEIGDGVLGGGSGGHEEAELVGDLFSGTGGERDDGSEQDAPAAEEGIAS